MKTKKESKFTLEKFEVAKLKNPKAIQGGLGDGGVIGGTGNAGANSSAKCADPNQTPTPKP